MKKFALYLLFLICITACGPRQLLIGGDSDDLSNSTLDAVVLLEGGCSGVLVAPRIILTAAHCLGGRITIGGNSPIWSTTEPVWLPFTLPAPQANPCCTTGTRPSTRDAVFTATENTDILGFDVESFANREVPADMIPSLEEAESSGVDLSSTELLCEWACSQRDYCTAYTHIAAGVSGPRSSCFLKSPRMRVEFGNDRTEMHHTAFAMDYSMAGFDDIAAIRLTEPVSRNVALPSHVFIRSPDHDTDSASFVNFLDSRRYTMAGWGGGRQVRQTADGEFDVFPLVSFGVLQPNLMRITSRSGVSLEPGDSGSPVFTSFSPSYGEFYAPYFERILAERRGFVSYNPRVVMGIAQGVEGGGGRYVVTFGTGGPTGTDGAGFAKPMIWQWLNNLLSDSLVEHTTHFPGIP